MSIITRIQKDHDEIKRYYLEYEKFRATGDWKEATKWYNQFAWEVARHSAAEELILYPFMEKHAIGNVAQNRLELQAVKENIVKLESLQVQQVEFQNLLKIVMNTLEVHMDHEEQTELAALSKKFDVNKLDKLGDKYQRAKSFVPTSAHPNAPNRGGFKGTISGLLTMPFDKLKDAFKEFPTDEQVQRVEQGGV